MSYLHDMERAARAGGTIIRNYFGAALELTQKSSLADVRTQADLDSEAAILAILETAYPEYSIHSEERGHVDRNSAYQFVIDPLDGTHNFVLGIPLFSVSIALRRGNEIIAGVVYHVMLDELYSAERGRGAYRNGEPIQVNRITEVHDATFSYVARYGVPAEEENAVFSATIQSTLKRILTLWSPALDFCLLASGRIEAMLVSEAQPYDYMAGKLIAKEAGAYIALVNGEKEESEDGHSFLITSTPELHDSLSALLRNVHTQ